MSTARGSVAQLSHLPVEILHKIAYLLDAESVLAFTQTCKTARSTCYAIIVFRTLLEQNSDKFGRTFCAADRGLSTGPPLNHCDSTDRCQLQLQLSAVAEFTGGSIKTWADVAVADARAAKEVSSRPMPDSSRLLADTSSGMVKTTMNLSLVIARLLYAAPHLVFFKHPIIGTKIVAIGLSETVKMFRRTGNLDDPRLALWYCASMLTCPLGYDEDTKWAVLDEAANVLTHYIRREAPLRNRVLTLFALGAAARAIRLNVQMKWDELSAEDAPQEDVEKFIQLPTLAHISFQYLQNHQMPPLSPSPSKDSISGWSPWLAAYTESLRQSAYIDDPAGWSCYFLGAEQASTSAVVQVRQQIRRPWRGIKFRTEQSQFNPSTLILQTCSGGDESARIYGRIGSNGSGYAAVVHGRPSTLHYWEFILTPFGIFGRSRSCGDGSTLPQHPSPWEIEHSLLLRFHRMTSRPLRYEMFWMWKEEFNDRTSQESGKSSH